MKKAFRILMAAVLTLSLVACGQAANHESISSNTQSYPESESEASSQFPQSDLEKESTDTAVNEKVLVAYFSWSGSTEEMASYIAKQTGGDLLEIQPETPYPTDYNECGDVAKTERDNDERPAIANLPKSIDEYDTILIGYPIWWHTAPMIIGTFLDSYDLTNVEVYPFTQSASMDTEQFNNSITFVRENANGAIVHDGLFARPSDTDRIDTYLLENNLME